MCGIVGYIGKEKCIPKIIKALEALEYRGYDSAGIAYVENKITNIIKEKGKIENLKKEIDESIETNLGIGHTRWATHGEANKINAHPHQSGNITLVHNGIIENYSDIKKDLIEKGYNFKSETDTEVATALIDLLYKEEKDILKALKRANSILRGSYAFGIIVDGDNALYAMKKASPLIIGTSKDGNFIASDVPAILRFTNKYILLDDNEIVKLTENNIKIYNNNLEEIKKDINTYEGSLDSATKCGYEHFMLKEINEEDEVFKNTINYYFDGTMKSLENNFGFIKNYKNIDIVACGSAYHAGVVGKYLLEEFANIPVNVEVASEYRYKKCFYTDKTLLIVVSQSGETADTLAALKKAKNDGISTLAIVNVLGSSIAREADHVVYTKAGFEIAVATTKAYLAQIAIFSLLSLYLGKEKNIISKEKYESIQNNIKELPSLIKEAINDKTYIEIADKISNKNQIFFIGRGIDYALALEASLKLKEISYINSVAYQAGELKHGTISLIEKGTPVIAISTDDNLSEKLISNVKEVKARGANVIYVTNKKPDEKFYDSIIYINKTNTILQAILTIIPLQLLAYQIAKNKNCDIDKPRNLAKSVTVE